MEGVPVISQRIDSEAQRPSSGLSRRHGRPHVPRRPVLFRACGCWAGAKVGRVAVRKDTYAGAQRRG